MGSYLFLPFWHSGRCGRLWNSSKISDKTNTRCLPPSRSPNLTSHTLFRPKYSWRSQGAFPEIAEGRRLPLDREGQNMGRHRPQNHLGYKCALPLRTHHIARQQSTYYYHRNTWHARPRAKQRLHRNRTTKLRHTHLIMYKRPGPLL